MRLFTATLSALLLVCACDAGDEPASLPDAYEDWGAWVTATCELDIECDPAAWQELEDPQAWCEMGRLSQADINPCLDELVAWKTCQAQERLDNGCASVDISGDPCADLQVSLDDCYAEKL